MVGDGAPLGAAQIKRAVPPLTTPASFGSSRNLSLKTERNHKFTTWFAIEITEDTLFCKNAFEQP